MAKAGARYADLQRFEVEALFLLDRFEGLSEPTITRVHPPALQERVTGALRRVAGIVLARAKNLPTRLVSASARDAALLKARIKDTPTAAILAAAGDHAEDHATRHDRAMRESRGRHDAERKAEVERLDRWLSDQLARAPIPKTTIIERATAEGIPVAGPGEATVTASAGRLKVFGAQRDGDPETVYWATGRLPDGFQIPTSWARRMGMGAAMR